MLVLTRKPGESIIIGGDIELSVSHISGNRVKIAIKAPLERIVRRGEMVKTPPSATDQVRIPAGAAVR